MIYRSKKDPEVTASFDFEDTKCATTRLIYLSGDKKGKSFVVSNSTLKRWWEKVEDKKTDNLLDINMEEVNKPYKPDVTPHYIPKPQSVIEYEAKKNRKYNNNLPELETIAEELGEYLIRVNDKYIKFEGGTTLWRKSGGIDIYATETIWEALTKLGFQSKPNKDKDRPFAFHITTQEEYDKAVSVWTAH